MFCIKCLKVTKMLGWKGAGLIAAGAVLGAVGTKALTSKRAKKLYAGATAAALRAKDRVMETAGRIQEHAGDIYAEAQQINAEREAASGEMAS